MTEEMKKGFVARVAQANRSQLIVLLYEMMDVCLLEAEEKFEAGEEKDFRKNIKQFRGFLNELMGSLDYQYPVSHELIRLYIWADKTAVKAVSTGEIAELPKLRGILDTLKKGFEKVAEQDNGPSVMEHAETIYAGLTYGKGSLNETVGLGNEKRGYQV